MNTLATLVNVTLEIEKLRVASQVRIAHLNKQKRPDPEIEEVHKRLVGLEEHIDSRIAVHLKSHPAYPWFSRVKGVGRENIGKVVGLCRVKPEKGDAKWCPTCDKRVPFVAESCRSCGGEVEERIIDLPYADSISGLWKFAGMSVEDGKAPKREAGKVLDYNSQLRSMCWRLGTSLMKARGKFYDYYSEQKVAYLDRYAKAGVKVVPAAQLPKKNGKRYEPEGIISEGHVHNQALRKMIKLFLSCLWLSWREAEGLPVSKPYAIDILNHASFITPEEMTDR